MQFFEKLFCRHDYEKITWYEEYDEVHNVRYSMRLYRCRKCGKEVWVDGRDDTEYIFPKKRKCL